MAARLINSPRQASPDRFKRLKILNVILSFTLFPVPIVNAYNVRSFISAGIAAPFSAAAFSHPLHAWQASKAVSSAQSSSTPRDDLGAAENTYSNQPTYEHRLEVAATEISAGSFSRAKALLERLQQPKESVEFYSLLGQANEGLGDYRAAAIEFQKAAELDPSEGNIFDYGTSLFRLDHGAAITILRYGLQKYPQSIRLRVALGTVLYADGNTPEGARMLCDAEDLNPSDPHPIEVLAETEIVPPELSARLTAQFASLRQKYPNDGLILFDYAMVRSGKWSKMLITLQPDFADSLKKALRLNPNLHRAYFQLSQLAAEREDFSEQIRLLKKAISIAPNEEIYHYQLAFAYKKSGDDQGSRREMKQFQHLHASESNAH